MSTANLDGVHGLRNSFEVGILGVNSELFKKFKDFYIDLLSECKKKTHDEFIEKKLTETTYRSHNFNVIPPIIGIIISDQYGNTITVFEYDSKDENDFGPIKSYLSEGEKDLLEFDSQIFHLFNLFFLFG